MIPRSIAQYKLRYHQRALASIKGHQVVQDTLYGGGRLEPMALQRMRMQFSVPVSGPHHQTLLGS